MKTQKISLFFFLTLSACGPNQVSGGGETETGSETETETGDLEPEYDWAAIDCHVKSGPLTSCHGLPVSSEDAWVSVRARCEMDKMITTGAWELSEGWAADACAAASSPDNFLPSSVCYYLPNSGSSQCWSCGLDENGDEWCTPIRPTCAATIGPDPAWPFWQCEIDAGSIGDHPWDVVGCYDQVMYDCTAAIGADTMEVWPTCWVAGMFDTEVDCIGG